MVFQHHGHKKTKSWLNEMRSWLKKKFSLVHKINVLKEKVKEERIRTRTWMILCADKVDEIDMLQREARLVWNIYGIDYREQLSGLGGLMTELRDEMEWQRRNSK